MLLHSLTHINIFTKFDLCAQNSFSRNIMRITIRAMCQKRNLLDKQILQCRSELSKICPVVLLQSIRAKIRELNSGLCDDLHQTKTLKLQQLIGPQITDETTLHSHNTVVTIPENLPLTDSEKSVLSKGLNFVPITKCTNEFSIKQDVENLMTKRMIRTLLTKIFLKHFKFANLNGLTQRGNFASLDFFTKKCRHDIHKLKFNRNTKFSNLSSEEWGALKNLRKRNDIVVKSADLYKKEALRQLSDTSFYAKIQKNLTSKNQKLSKTPFRI